MKDISTIIEELRGILNVEYSKRDELRAMQVQALITALKRHGYTHHDLGIRYTASGYVVHEPIYEVVCEAVKPIVVYWSKEDELTVLHGGICQYNSHAHEQAYLQEMIPVIGRLDAKAILDPGIKGECAPRLRIEMRVS